MSTLEVVNSLTVETMDGFKDFILMRGDISQIDTELLIFSSHAAGQEIHGAVSASIRSKFGEYKRNNAQTIISLGKGSFFDIKAIHPENHDSIATPGTYLIEPNDNMPFKHLMVIKIPGAAYFDSSEESLNAFEKCVEAVFASVSALEFYDYTYRTIAMSVLGGGRSYDKSRTMPIFLKNAIKWLKHSRFTYKFTLTVYDNKEVKLWNEAMNESLGRSFDDGSYSSSIKDLHNRLKENVEYLSIKTTHSKLKDVLDRISKSLTLKQEISIQQFGNYGRQLSESISGLVCEDLGLSVSNNAFSNIEKINEVKKVSKWINSYLHSLRILGNESVHLMDEGERIPQKLTSGDLLVIFSNILRVLDFYEMWCEKKPDAKKSLTIK